MRIEQFVIDFDSIEDRLLLSVHTDGSSIRIWLTRRYVSLLRDALAEIVRVELISTQPLAVGSTEMLAEFVHEQAIAKLDLSTPPVSRHYDSVSDPHVGVTAVQSLEAFDAEAACSQPWLAFKLQVSWDESDSRKRRATGLTISPLDGVGVTLGLSNDLPYALVQMLSQATEAAQWQLDFAALGANGYGVSMSSDAAHLH